MMRFIFTFAYSGGTIVLDGECKSVELVAAYRATEDRAESIAGGDVKMTGSRVSLVRRGVAV